MAHKHTLIITLGGKKTIWKAQELDYGGTPDYHEPPMTPTLVPKPI